MSTTAYKNRRAGRVLTDQAAFGKGVHYTNQEVPAGFAKLLVNFNIKDNGSALVPREAYTSTFDDFQIITVDAHTYSSTPALGPTHFAGLLYVEDADSTDLNLADVMLSVGNTLPYSVDPVVAIQTDYALAVAQRLDSSISNVFLGDANNQEWYVEPEPKG